MKCLNCGCEFNGKFCPQCGFDSRLANNQVFTQAPPSSSDSPVTSPPVGHYQPIYPNMNQPRKKRPWLIVFAIIPVIIIASLVIFIAGLNQKNIKSLEWNASDPVILTESEQVEKNWVIVEPSAFEDGDIIFISSDENVATVVAGTKTSGGQWYEITAVGNGNATIYAQSADGTIKTSELSVTVDIAPAEPEVTLPSSDSDELPSQSAAPEDVQIIIDFILPTLQENFPDYCDVYYDAENNSITIAISAYGVTDEVAAIQANGGDETNPDWSYMKDSMLDMFDSVRLVVDTLGGEAYNITLAVLNDYNYENVLLMIHNGEVVYDVLAE